MKRILLAKNAGFCAGVARTVALAEKELAENGELWCLGELIHNRDEIMRLERAGMKTAETVDQIPAGSAVIIRSHGVGKDVYAELEKRMCRIIDGTCGRVKRIHRIAEEAAARGKTLVVFGAAAHPEVRGICGWCPQSVVVERLSSLEAVLTDCCDRNPNGVYMLFQSTETQENLKNSQIIQKKYVQIANCLIQYAMLRRLDSQKH